MTGNTLGSSCKNRIRKRAIVIASAILFTCIIALPVAALGQIGRTDAPKDKSDGSSKSKPAPKSNTTKKTTKSQRADEKNRPTEASPEEQALWDEVKDSSDPMDLQAYLNKYPDGRYSDKAETQIELIYWNKAKNSQDPSDYKAYLNNYPNGKYSDNAKSQIELLNWDKIKNSQDPADYDGFLEKFPKGKYSGAARKRRTDVELSIWNRVKDSQNPDELKEYLNKFPNGTFEGLAKNRMPKVENEYEETLWNRVKDSQNPDDFDAYLSRYPDGRFTNQAKKQALLLRFERGFVRIPAGEFMMGSNNKVDEKPAHRIRISREFEMGKYEVMQAQWEDVMGSNPSWFKGADLPVEQVSWEDVQQFVEKLNDRSRKYDYRLPTEAEWEYACRAGSSGDYAGDLDSMAWYGNNSDGKTHPVGQKQANAWGLYDMHGNVYEWCQDWYDVNYYSHSNDADPSGPYSGSYRVYRGGSWFGIAKSWLPASRNGGVPGYRSRLLGFRLVRTAK